MASGNLKRLREDTSGAAFLEFTVFATVFFGILFGIIEITLAFYQWNAGTKAVQLGARLAAVSDPVSSELAVATWDVDGYDPGDFVAMADGYTIECSGAGAGSCTGSGVYNAAAMNTLVYGRGDAACGQAKTSEYAGMCDLFWRVTPENVRVIYTYTGLGYAGRPGGPVPSIRVELVDIPFQFYFLSALLGDETIDIPGLSSTISGEDLTVTGS
jgi:Flp pilus assembly protein TadG